MPLDVVASPGVPQAVVKTYRISHNTNRIPCRQTRQPNTKSTCQMHESVVQAVRLLWWRLHVTGNQDRDYERVDRNNTGHDHWDQGLRHSISICSLTLLQRFRDIPS